MAITKERAQKDGLTGGCPLVDGKEKLNLDAMEGQVVTIKEYGECRTDKGDIYAVVFDEFQGAYIWAPSAVSKLIDNYGDEVIGTRLKIGAKTKTKGGRDFRPFDIVD